MSEVLPMLEKKLREAQLEPAVLELALEALKLCATTNPHTVAEELNGVVAKIYKKKHRNGIEQ